MYTNMPSPGASVILDLLDVDARLADEELVVLRLGADLHRDAAQLLLLAELWSVLMCVRCFSGQFIQNLISKNSSLRRYMKNLSLFLFKVLPMIMAFGVQ